MVAHQASLFMGFSSQYWSGWHVLLQGIFPTQGSNLSLACLLHSQADSLPLAPPRKHWLKLFLDGVNSHTHIWGNSPIPVHFTSLIPKMSIFTLAISCLTTSDMPWFKNLTLRVSMQYCSLQRRTWLPSPITSAMGVVLALAPSLHSFWNYFSTDLQYHIGHLLNWGVHLSVSTFVLFHAVASGGDRIWVEIFQILKNDAVNMLHSICQQIWKSQQWPQDWKRSVFIAIPKKGNAKKMLKLPHNYTHLTC